MVLEYDLAADYYAILGVGDDATSADIRKAHRARIRDLHPTAAAIQRGRPRSTLRVACS